MAYEYGDETVISYRGTNDVDGLGDVIIPSDDVYHGWTLGAGNTASEQGLMAALVHGLIL